MRFGNFLYNFDMRLIIKIANVIYIALHLISI